MLFSLELLKFDAFCPVFVKIYFETSLSCVVPIGVQPTENGLIPSFVFSGVSLVAPRF